MRAGKFNVVLDAQWGSSGKGKLCAFLADMYGATQASSSNMPNAGHTVQFEGGGRYIFKCLPSALALNAERGRSITGWISPGSSFFVERFIQELVESESSVRVHARAQIMQNKHREAEATATRHVASTMQGCGAALCEKIMRGPQVKLAGSQLFDTADAAILEPDTFRYLTHDALRRGAMWLHEVSQGYALSIDHGTHYPYCTSRNCTTQAALDQMSVPPAMLGDVYLNLRPFPIRVGNVVDETGHEVGNSGPFEPWGREVTWDYVAEKSGMPSEERDLLFKNELTTVTKRLRRVGTLSNKWIREACLYNGVTKLCLNFANYVDWSCKGMRGDSRAVLPKKVREFIDNLEDEVGLAPVAFVGTGPNHEDMVACE